ncbi:MAG: dihydrofolate reductase family protein [Holophagae bacterium]|jgi:dihydrofolate reductase
MRRIVYSVAMSLDGFIAAPDGEYDWIPNEPDIDWGAFIERFDTVLMGRRSYEAALTAPGGGALPDLRTIVISTTLRPEDHPDVRVVSKEVDRVIEALRRASGKDIWLFGGGSLFRSLLERGHVDRVEIGLIPVLLGGGIPLLPQPAATVPLRLVDQHTYPTTGTVLLTYEVQRPAT